MLNWKEYAFISEKYLRVQERMYFISPEELEDIRKNVFLHILQNRALAQIIHGAGILKMAVCCKML
jgi:hypothetical protein